MHNYLIFDELAMLNWRQIINVGIAIAALAAILILITTLWQNRFDSVLTSLVLKNFAVIIGLPFAFISAFVVIALFRQGENAVEFKGFGLEFKGASGEVILWIICFMAVSGAIKILWKD